MTSIPENLDKAVFDRAASVVRQFIPASESNKVLAEALQRFQELDLDTITDPAENMEAQFRIVLDTIVEHWQDSQMQRLKTWGLVSESEVAA